MNMKPGSQAPNPIVSVFAIVFLRQTQELRLKYFLIVFVLLQL